MVKKIDPTKVSGVKSTATTAVTGTADIKGVGGIKSVGNVGAVRGTKAISGALKVGGVMSSAQKKQLLLMVEEEADKMFNEGILPKSQREVVKSAVMMALEAAILVEEETEKE